MIKKAIFILAVTCLCSNLSYASELMSEEALTHYNKAVETQGENNVQEAQMLYQMAIVIDSEGICKKFAFNNLGVMYLNAGKIKKAEYFFNEALKVDPTYEIAKSNLFLLYLKKAMVFKKQGRKEKALDNLGKAFRYFSEDSFIIEGKR